jgi:hypothetical protein
MKRLTIVISCVIILGAQYSCKQEKSVSSDQKMNVFIDDLIKKMTLDEKIGQI